MRTPGGLVRVTDGPRYAPEWLALREDADAAARAPGLLGPLQQLVARTATSAEREAGLRGTGRREAGLVIRDLGCGTGSMGRWLAPRLHAPQHWILHDRDPGLLALAATRMPRTAADGSRLAVTTAPGDLTRLVAPDLAGTSLVTASALLDLLTRGELNGLVAACAGAGCPALLTLSVAGRVDLTPADPLDAAIRDAFNAHQRRVVDGRRLLGPAAAPAASLAFARHGMTVRVEASPWRLGDAYGPALTAEWLRGWVGAAREQRPDLAPDADAYLRRRLAQCAAGGLEVVVHHSDVLALPRWTGGAA